MCNCFAPGVWACGLSSICHELLCGYKWARSELKQSRHRPTVAASAPLKGHVLILHVQGPHSVTAEAVYRRPSHGCSAMGGDGRCKGSVKARSSSCCSLQDASCPSHSKGAEEVAFPFQALALEAQS